jgi:hypothetical protein
MGYEIAFDKAVIDIKAKNPVTVCSHANVEYSAALRQYCVSFFGRPHIVDVESGEIFDQATGNRCAIGTRLLILHYLIYAQNVDPSGQWVTLKEVPHGGALFYPAFKNQVLDVLVDAFQYDLDAFEQAAALLNGKQIKMGDRAAVFTALPKVPLAVLMWQADEEFGGSANILFDKTIEYFSPIETIISFGYYLGHKLVNSPFIPSTRWRKDPIWDEDI